MNRHSERIGAILALMMLIAGAASQVSATFADEKDCSLPLQSPRWYVPVENDPAGEHLIGQTAAEYARRELSAIPQLQALAVGDSVIMRTTTSIMKIDFRTGKRDWHFPWERAKDELRATVPHRPQSDARVQAQFLEQRIWQDVPFSQIAADGERIFLLDDVGTAAWANANPFVVGARGERFPNPLTPRSDNRLVALNLNRHGALAWMVGKSTGEDEPKLAGAHFLGGPQVVGEILYALAEIDGKVKLVVLAVSTGKLDWSIEVFDASERLITNDPSRRLVGAQPIIDGDVAICPTAAGRAVAVDLIEKTVVWQYEYETVNRESEQIGFGRMVHFDRRLPGKRWLCNQVIVVDARVLLAPADSEELHCVDLKTGKPVWAAKPREDNLYIACVHGGNATLVGKRSLSSIKLVSGESDWETELPDGATPSGRGVRCGKHYLLPTMTTELLKFNLENGEIVGRVKTDRVLGNLTQHKAIIVSHGFDHVAAYEQRETVEKKVDARLRDNPDDVWALTKSAELKLLDDKPAEALATLLRAYQLDKQQPATNQLLVSTLLDALRRDFAAHSKTAEQLQSLVNQSSRRAEYMRVRAVGLASAGDHMDAFHTLLEITDTEPQSLTTFISPEPNLQVRQDRWIQSQLAKLREAATPQEREMMDEALNKRRQAALDAGNDSALRRLID